MDKGQQQIIQFIIFFIIGLAIFLSIGFFNRVQSDLFREDVADSTRKLINSYVSSIALMSMDTCKQCDSVKVSTKIGDTSADYFYELHLTGLGLDVVSQPIGKSHSSTMHNLIYSISDLNGSSASNKPIILTLTKPKNKLEVS